MAEAFSLSGTITKRDAEKTTKQQKSKMYNVKLFRIVLYTI
jgi:hypothetical protein